MDKETLIKKWLDHDLDVDEQMAFEALEEAEELKGLSASMKQFRAPEFDVVSEFAALNDRLETKSKTNWMRPLLRIAAILALSFSAFYLVNSMDTDISTEIAAKTTTELPDASSVNLNALSTLTYNKSRWSKSREVHLEGEAFFKVAKGSTFEVKTDAGSVKVLGTEFNVKSRENNFEVTCYEGLVSVTFKEHNLKLYPGQRFAVIDGKIIENEKETQALPSWMAQESRFESRPLKFVLAELERQYNITVTTKAVDLQTMYTGGFTHTDLDLALKFITLPLQLEYQRNNSEIVITGE